MSYHWCLILILVIYRSINADQTPLQCGDWVAYKDEKCIKVIDNHELQNFEDSKYFCNRLDNGSSLVAIRSQEEQDFLFNLLHNVNKVVNDVWIGAVYKEKALKWTDNTAVNYTNWASGNPKLDSGNDCVEISMDESFNGKWFSEHCERNNTIVCEKQQNWLFSYMQKTVMDLREFVTKQTLQYESTKKLLDTTRTELETTKTQLSQLTQKSAELSPPGTVAYFTRNSPPTGWLKANGQVLSRTTYATLFAVIGTTFGAGDGSTTFSVPDLRGEFIRGWSDGSDVDKARVFGSNQNGSDIPLVGNINNVSTYAAATGFQSRWAFAGVSFDGGFEANVVSGQIRDGITFPNDNTNNQMNFVAAGTAGVITHWNVFRGTRSRNVALLACIKF